MGGLKKHPDSDWEVIEWLHPYIEEGVVEVDKDEYFLSNSVLYIWIDIKSAFKDGMSRNRVKDYLRRNHFISHNGNSYRQIKNN